MKFLGLLVQEGRLGAFTLAQAVRRSIRHDAHIALVIGIVALGAIASLAW